MDAIQRADEVVVRQAEADAYQVVHAEMVAGHDKHAFFLSQPLGELRGVDVEPVSYEGDGGGPALPSPRRRSAGAGDRRFSGS